MRWRIVAGQASFAGSLTGRPFLAERSMDGLSNPACAHTCSASVAMGSDAYMEYDLPLNGPIGLDALDDYLMSDHAPDDSMGLSDLDGFLTGVVVGPEVICRANGCR